MLFRRKMGKGPFSSGIIPFSPNIMEKEGLSLFLKKGNLSPFFSVWLRRKE